VYSVNELAGALRPGRSNVALGTVKVPTATFQPPNVPLIFGYSREVK
jgi:hypothetical protein